MKPKKMILFGILGSLVFAKLSCSVAEKVAETVDDALSAKFSDLKGQLATRLLALAPGADKIDIEALSEALSVAQKESSKKVLSLHGFSLAEAEEEVSQVKSKTIDLFKSYENQKQDIKTKDFALIPDANFALAYGTNALNLTTLHEIKNRGGHLSLTQNRGDTLSAGSWPAGVSEILISNMNRVPVRHQGQRGTCASFAAVGHLEYLIINKFGDKLSTIDLSEQRFYMMSLPEFWNSNPVGGVTDKDAGSVPDNGFMMSYGKSKGQTIPSDNPEYNIPLEVDCPYNGSPGANNHKCLSFDPAEEARFG